MTLRITTALSALLFLAACQSAPTPEPEAAAVTTAPGAMAVTLTSADPIDFSDILRSNGAARTVPAELYLPEGAKGPVPAVVIASGEEGIGERERMYAGELTRAGVAALIPGSVAARGGEGADLSYAAQLRDLLAAYQFLAQDERFDDRRIGTLGFSRGGTAAYLAAHKPFLRAVAGDEAAFAAHLPVYPICTWRLEEFETAEVPVFFIWGAKDDLAPSEQCLPVVNALTKGGNAIASKTYANAYHAFDMAPIAVRERPELRRLVGCLNEIDAAGETVLTGKNAKALALEGDFATYQASALGQCGQSGARTGAAIDWRGNIARDVINFFEQSLNPGTMVF